MLHRLQFLLLFCQETVPLTNFFVHSFNCVPSGYGSDAHGQFQQDKLFLCHSCQWSPLHSGDLQQHLQVCWKAQKRNGFVRLVLCHFDYLFFVVSDCEMMNGLRTDWSLLICFSKSLLQLLQKSQTVNPTTGLFNMQSHNQSWNTVT